MSEPKPSLFQGISLQQSALRRKPNAFNLLHQLKIERRCSNSSASRSLEAGRDDFKLASGIFSFIMIHVIHH